MSTPTGLAELHRHLDGSLRSATVSELAAGLGLAVPPDLAFFPGMGLAEALARFAFTLSLLQTPAAVRRVAREILEDAAAEGIDTLELRFAPQLHRGAMPEAIVDSALEGLDGRAGLILCALYGEDPAILAALVEIAGPRPGVVGVDLAGGPAPSHRWRLADYAPAFRRAGDLGLGRTVHAGEGRPPAEIAEAVFSLHAERVGHGTTLLDDDAVLDLVLARGVTVEACVTSNWHVGAIPTLAAHPLPRWLARGVRVTACADNTLLSGVTLPEELARIARLPGMTGIDALTAHGHAAAFPRTRALLGRP
jgi:adenosine deaminase